MKRWRLGLFCVLMSGTVLAAGPSAVRKRVQASVLVTGTIEVAPDGSVHGYALDHPEKLPPVVIDVMGKNAPRWRFKPVLVDGHGVLTKARMSLRFVAKPAGHGNYAVSIAGARFGENVPGKEISARLREPPRYPRSAAIARVSGTVYLVLRVNRQGRVLDAAAEQVDIDEVASDAELARWRRVLADDSLEAARRWTFNAPTSGPAATAPYWIVRVPVAFNLHRRGAPRGDVYGQWKAYVPGPRQQVPWLNQRQLASGTDALAPGGIYMAGEGLQLTTSLNGA